MPALRGRIKVAEMPPGPPVLQSVVAEAYGPDAETRRQVANSTIIETLSTAMGGYRISDVSVGSALEPTWVVVQASLALRASSRAMADLSVPTPDGRTIPLGELGHFVRAQEDHVYFKDKMRLDFLVGVSCYGGKQDADLDLDGDEELRRASSALNAAKVSGGAKTMCWARRGFTTSIDA